MFDENSELLGPVVCLTVLGVVGLSRAVTSARWVLWRRSFTGSRGVADALHRLSTGTLLKEPWKRRWAHKCRCQTLRFPVNIGPPRIQVSLHQDPGPGRKSLLPLPDVVQESRLCGSSAGPPVFLVGTWSSLRWVYLQDGILVDRQKDWFDYHNHNMQFWW